MTTQQRKFLLGRLRTASAEQPEVMRLKQILLRLGGVYLVAPSSFDFEIPGLLERGLVMSGQIKFKKMRSNSCHQNASTAWQSRVRKVIAIGTGYALSEDGLWRQHSWGVLRDGLLETTELRVKYFGLLLQGAEAQAFSERCLS